MATSADTTVQGQQFIPPPAAFVAAQHSYTAHGSVGPVIAVVVVIAVLGVVAGMIGRICAGRTVMGYGHFDVEAWLDTKFSSCIDGHVDPPPVRRYRPPPEYEAPMPDAGDGDGESGQPPESTAADEPVGDKEEEGEEGEKENSHEHAQSS